MAREMKDSGVEWIGEIPKEWEVIKLKKIAKIQTGNTPSKVIDNVKYYCDKEENNGFLWIKPNDLKEFQYITDSSEKLTEEGKKVARIAPKNSILVCCIGSIGKFGIVDKEVAFNQQINSVSFNSKIFFKYGVYLISSSESQHWLYSNGNVVKILNNEGQGGISCPLPPLEEQEKIANYLDKKVSDIDLIIEKTKATIEDYKKYKQSVITEAVTKGINPNVEMKDSGIEWIGEIPKEWEVRKLKNDFLFRKGLSITKEKLKLTGIPVINYGQIHSKDNNGIKIIDGLIRYVDESYLETDFDSLVSEGDFIFADTSEDLGGSGNNIYISKVDKLFAGYHTIILKTKIQRENKYLAYLFKTDCWRSQIRSRVTGIKLFSITQKILKETTTIIPPLEEQKQIAEYLDKKTSEIDTLITKKEALITELEEYKKSLIYECVTGKKEIK